MARPNGGGIFLEVFEPATFTWTAGGGAGTGTRIIALSTSRIVWVDAPVGTSATATLFIYSTGTARLTVSSISYSSPVFSGNWSGVIESNGTQAVTVTFSPKQAGAYSGTLTVNADQTAISGPSGSTTVALSGTGVGQ